LATEDEGTGDNGVIGLAEDTDGTEEVLPGSLETVEETTDLVGRHEGLGELLVVLEVDSPDGESLAVELLVEPWDGTGSGVQVGVLSLPLLEVEGRLRQVVKRVLDFWLRWDIRLLLVVISRLRGLGLGSLGLCWLGLLWLRVLLGLLGWGSVGGLGLSQLGLAVVEDGSELGLVDNAGMSSEPCRTRFTYVSKYRTTLGIFSRVALSTRPVKALPREVTTKTSARVIRSPTRKVLEARILSRSSRRPTRPSYIPWKVWRLATGRNR
jgi:hypothetical protein